MDFHSFSQIKALVFILLSGFISSTKRQTLTIKRRRPDDLHLTTNKKIKRKRGGETSSNAIEAIKAGLGALTAV